jgi:hypothetical protein
MDQPAKKKVYEAPKLVRYGDLVEVTRAIVGRSGMFDNGGGRLKTK